MELTAQTGLRCLRVSNGALAAHALPNRIKVLSWGVNDSTQGPVILSERSIQVMKANQERLGFGRVALDYEHNTVPESDEFKRSSEPRPVAGYGDVELVPGDGLYLNSVNYTPSGTENAKNFCDLSPAIKTDPDGNVLFVHSVALARNGSVYGLQFHSAKQPEILMSEPNKAMIPLAVVAGALGLPADAAESVVTTELTKTIGGFRTFSAQLQDGKLVAIGDLETRLKALESAKPAPLTMLSATVDGKQVELKIDELLKLSARVEGIEKRVNDQASAGETAEKTRIIQSFSAKGQVPMGEDGKPLGAGQLVCLPLPMLRMLSANTPATVPLNARGGRPNEQQKREDLTGSARAGQAWAHLQK